MVPPDPLGVSPPFPMSMFTCERAVLGGEENGGGGTVEVHLTLSIDRRMESASATLRSGEVVGFLCGRVLLLVC